MQAWLLFTTALSLLVVASAAQAAPSYLMLGGRGSSGTPGGGGGGSTGTSCTDGTDCICDTISPASPLLLCEDWEAAGYYENNSNSWIAGAILDGAWNRGGSSDWVDRYGNGDHGFFRYGDGVPTLGTRCAFGSGGNTSYSGCSGMREYCSAAQGALAGAGSDCWGPGSNSASSLDVQQSGDFDDLVVTLALSGGHGVTADIGGGDQTLAHFINAGSQAGKVGTAYLKIGGGGDANNKSNVTEVGITMAIAYSSNIGTEADSVIDGPWKHNEWADNSQSYQEHWNLGNTGCGDTTDFPYRPFMWVTSQAACNAALSAATRTVGNYDCSDAPALRMCPGSAFDQATDFPYGTWACHQAHIRGLGTADVDIEVKHNGTTVLKLENFDGSALRNAYYNNFIWNAYSNINEDGDGTTNDTDVAMYRYEDNIVVVNGPPVSCAEIGY